MTGLSEKPDYELYIYQIKYGGLYATSTFRAVQIYIQAIKNHVAQMIKNHLDLMI